MRNRPFQLPSNSASVLTAWGTPPCAPRHPLACRKHAASMLCFVKAQPRKPPTLLQPATVPRCTFSEIPHCFARAFQLRTARLWPATYTHTNTYCALSEGCTSQSKCRTTVTTITLLLLRLLQLLVVAASRIVALAAATTTYHDHYHGGIPSHHYWSSPVFFSSGGSWQSSGSRLQSSSAEHTSDNDARLQTFLPASVSSRGPSRHQLLAEHTLGA